MLRRVHIGAAVKPRAASARGQSLTEFALVAPLFFMLVFGIMVLGIAVFYQQQITNVAREGSDMPRCTARRLGVQQCRI